MEATEEFQRLTPAERELVKRLAQDFKTPIADELKRSLAARLGPEVGFVCWKQALRSSLPPEINLDADLAKVELRPLVSLRTAAENSEVHIEIATSGRPFEIAPPRVIGEGNHRVLRGTSRSVYLTCLSDVRVRSASSVIDTGKTALMDFEGSELTRCDDMLDRDPSIFSFTINDQAAWIAVPDRHSTVDIEEAYSLFGISSLNFGHWLHEYVPRYVAALSTGYMPPVPVLINQRMPPTHRQLLELLLPKGASVMECPVVQTLRIGRLWIGSSTCYPMLLPKMNERLRPEYYASEPVVYARLAAEMVQRLERMVPPKRGPKKVYLARKHDGRRRLMNAAAIESLAEAAGFIIVYPEELSFADQYRTIRDAEFVIGPEGSAMALCIFSRPGTRVCILNHTYTEHLPVLTGLLKEIGLDVTVITGPIVNRNPDFIHFSDYELETAVVDYFLSEWR